MSKGSGRRPTDEDKYKDNYDKIFGKGTLERQVFEDLVQTYRDDLAEQLIKGNEYGITLPPLRK